jgi:hypothetical protein
MCKKESCGLSHHARWWSQPRLLVYFYVSVYICIDTYGHICIYTYVDIHTCRYTHMIIHLCVHSLHHIYIYYTHTIYILYTLICAHTYAYCNSQYILEACYSSRSMLPQVREFGDAVETSYFQNDGRVLFLARMKKTTNLTNPYTIRFHTVLWYLAFNSPKSDHLIIDG